MTATSTVRRAAKSDTVGAVARTGLAARATILLGVLALLVALGRTNSEADQRGAMQQLNRQAFGHALLWVIAVGLVGYALWRLSEAAFGVAGEGRKVGPRLHVICSGLHLRVPIV